MEIRGRQKQIVDERIKKIELLRNEGINPYTYKFEKNSYANELLENFKSLKKEEFGKGKKAECKIAGRILNIRDLGKIIFAKLQDSSGEIQIVLQEEKTPSKTINFFKKFVDSGDIVGVDGKIFRTQRGELSVSVEDLSVISKSVFPLPEKWHGLTDDEERLRKRYLDIIMNPDVKEMFRKKSKFWNVIRCFLVDNSFMEVETPALENSAGGAAATPFKTHHNALDSDVYLRISMGELWQKKLLVAGYEKIFEIGRQFRNEGMDMEHLQDYTQMEFYWAYADYKDGMKLVEEMYKKVAMEILGALKFKTHGFDVDLGKKWVEYDYENLIKEKTGVDIYKADKKEIMKFLDKEKMDYDDKVDKWKLVDLLWKFCRRQIAGPGFLVGQPVEISPLAKRSRDDPRKVEQFQIIIAGTEMGNGYSELNDPFDQEKRFLEQRKKKEAGDTEAHEHDESFVEALKYGMPPACGFGISERFFSYLVDKPVRECVFFPLMKAKGDDDGTSD
jgi:lysyl-tRNA synthetase, class II